MGGRSACSFGGDVEHLHRLVLPRGNAVPVPSDDSQLCAAPALAAPFAPLPCARALSQCSGSSSDVQPVSRSLSWGSVNAPDDMEAISTEEIKNLFAEANHVFAAKAGHDEGHVRMLRTSPAP